MSKDFGPKGHAASLRLVFNPRSIEGMNTLSASVTPNLRDIAMPKLAQGGAASAATILHELLNNTDAIELPDGRRALVVPVDSDLADALMLFDPDGDPDREPDADGEPDYDNEVLYAGGLAR